jgi:glycosyltransferase involved in cell wall biosynthesis
MIFDMRGLMAEEYVDAGLWEKDSFQYKIISSAEKYFVRRAEEVVILNEKTRKILFTDRGEAKNITIIPTCVDLEKFDFDRKPNNTLATKYSLNGKIVLMYVGSIGTWYMISEMVDFYTELSKSMDNAVFFILSQTEKSCIEKYIPGAFKTKIMIDSAKANQVPDFLNLANMGIFFIRPCLSKIASCPTKFGEYLACGLPVVINKGIGDTEEIVRANRVGVVIENFTSEEYIKTTGKIKELLKEGEALRKRCRNTAERYFSLADGAKKYYGIYSRLADTK